MAFTIDDYNALCANIAQGVRTVKYADKEVEYRSLADMISLKTLMESELGINTNSKPRVRWAKQSMGLYDRKKFY